MKNWRAKNKFYRKPKTHQEQAKYFDEPDLVRPARRPIKLPDSYSDVINKGKYDKCWKRDRKTQYTDSSYKKYSYMIPIDISDCVCYQIIDNIKKQLQINNYSYRTRYANSLDGQCFIIEWTGKRIGDWPKGKYL